MGEAQIHREGFRESFDVDSTVANVDSVMAALGRSPLVKDFAARTLAFSMISSPANMSAISLVGVDPERERRLSQIDDALVEGSYFDASTPREIIIGSKLAEVLEVHIGSRVVVTATQAHTADLSQEMFRVSGIYRFNMRELDNAFAFIRLHKAQEMLNLEGQVHEIAITFHDRETPLRDDLPFWKKFSAGPNEALPWKALLPQLFTVFKMSEFNMLVGGLLLFGIVAFGIINTLFMSLHERMFEFGVMRAVGTRGWDLLRIVLFEASSLAVVAIVFGCIIGLVATLWVGQIGIDYGGIEYAGTTIRDRIYPMFSPDQYVIYPAALFLLTTLVGLYPAASAARLTPATAMRKSM
jgi:ABC-type lipoprotein release transport system permease subunit